jgi:hypothetical protein
MTPGVVAKRKQRATVARLRTYMERYGVTEEQVANRLRIDGARFWALLGGTAGSSEAERERIETMLGEGA